jgi:hypothetical protein
MSSWYGSWWRIAHGPGVAHITNINQGAADTVALACLTKTRGGGVGGGGGGGYCGITRVNGEDLSGQGFPPALFRRQVTSISFGIVSESQYAEGMLTLFHQP